MEQKYYSPSIQTAHSLRTFGKTDRNHIISHQKTSQVRYSNRQQPQTTRVRSDFGRKNLLSGSSESKWKRMFENNGLSSEFVNKKLTHRDVARLSEIINKQAKNLKSIKKILCRFEQQIEIEINSQTNLKKQTFSRQLTSHLPLRIKSKLPQELASTTRLNDIIERNKTSYNKKSINQNRKSLILTQTKKKNEVKRLEFKLNSQISKAFEQKIYKYLEFLLFINLSNRIYRNLDLLTGPTFKYYIGFGNNNMMIHSIMKKRSWWQEGTRQQSHFYWSQIKINKIHQKQKMSSKSYKRFHPYSASEKKQTSNPDDKAILKIMNLQDWNHIRKILSFKKSKFAQRIQMFGKTIHKQDLNQLRLVTNHLPNNGILGNKKALFLSLKLYYSLLNKKLSQIIPQTYHIRTTEDKQFSCFLEAFNKNKSKIWIIKPGQFSNRGQGIKVANKLQTILEILQKSEDPKKQNKTYILQHYINNPYLYNRRKFDIRAYMLLTKNNGILKGYWYEQGYIRTSSQIFDLNNLTNTFTHLTNDAIQKHSKKYGKFEEGNKLSYADFQRYLVNNKSKYDFYNDALPKMKTIARDAIKSTCLFIDRQNHLDNFQVFGLDFMITSKFDVYLIEINTNPCLQTECSLLSRIIPNMLQNAFRIGLDPIFPPPHQIRNNKHFISENAIFFNNFQLIFDQIKQKPYLDTLFLNNIDYLEEIQDLDQNKNIYLPESTLINYQYNHSETKQMN